MGTQKLEVIDSLTRVKPLCPYFGTCGGCTYQDLSYEDELVLKEENLKQLFQEELGLPADSFLPIVPSPEPYFYRSRLDLSFRRRRGGIELGFNEEGTRRLVGVESCAIARPEISVFLPLLKQFATHRLPQDYRNANLVVKTGDTGEIRWGGIGRGSLRLPQSDYLWTEIEGKRIFYSLDTFFQANLGILPLLMKNLRSLLSLNRETSLLDLYAGVGLFWVVFASEVKEVWAVEENRAAIRLAEFNRNFHALSQVYLKEGRTEDCLDEILKGGEGKPKAGIVDPPRKGLSPLALEKLTQAKALSPLVYISCRPASLIRDLREFVRAGWRIDRVVPFDFFPRTPHLEVVVRLYPHEMD